MAVALKISMKGNQEIVKKLTRVERGVRDFKEPLDQLGKDLVDKFYGSEVFNTQGKALGENWKGLSPQTLAARVRRSGHYKNAPITTGKILIWTGRLKKAFQKKVTKTRLEITNNAKYFEYNQVKRPMLAINSRVITKAVEAIDKYLNKLLK